MQVPLAVLADYANTTGEGKLNIMGIFDTIFAASAPVIHGQMQLVFRLRAQPADRGQAKGVEVRLLDADGRLIVQFGTTLQLPDDFPLNGEIPQIIGFNNLRFERFGDYAFHILVNGETKAVVGFVVKELATQPSTT